MKTVFPLLGDKITIILYDVPVEISNDIVPQIRSEATRLQTIFSMYDEKSELSKLNRERQIVASQDLQMVMARALDYCEETGGAYDISKGKLYLARKAKTVLPKIACSYKDIIMADRTISLIHQDVLVDLNSIAKGYLVDALVRFINGLGIESAFLDARGDIRIYGSHFEIVDVQNPRGEGGVSTFVLENAAVATSGDYRQFDKTYDQSHILGQQDLISVSVMANSLMEADALASAIFLLGSEGAKELMRKRPDCKAIAIDKNMKVHVYNDWEEVECGIRN